MGGAGSGRGFQGGRATTSEMLALDVRRVQRDGLLIPGRASTWKWARNGEKVASIQMRAEADRVILDYSSRSNGGEWQAIEYPVSLEWTGCTLGGRRMAIKKSDLYSSLWASCDELRGGMDASQYKDYVLFMLFIKYISDKYGDSDDFAPPVTIPGASFKDMVALKGKSDIGDKINTQVIQPLIDANTRLARSDFPDFNDPNKLGEGQAMVDRLSNLIGIFQKPELDFSKNRAEHDDILGDAYEYLMRHFATESGKSKGQFYTPVRGQPHHGQGDRHLAANTKASTTAYDPTCGSGSLLLKVAAEAGKHITLEGQEKDVTTAGLARMNMILHDFPTANILSGNTLASPKFKDGEQLRTYDYVVANPPFSDKTWSTGLTPSPAIPSSASPGASRRQAGRLRLPAAHHPLDEEHRQRRLHPAARRALPRQCRGRHPQQLVRSGILKGHHRPARQPVLRHRHPGLHPGAGQGKRRRPQGHLHDRRLQGLHQGRATRTACASRTSTASSTPSPGRPTCRATPAWCRWPKSPTRRTTTTSTCRATSTAPSRRPAGHRRPPARRHPGARPRCARRLLEGAARRARRPCSSRRGRPGYARLKLPLAEVKPPSSAMPSSPPSTRGDPSCFADWRKAVTNRSERASAKDGHPKALIETIAEDLLATFRKAPLLDAYDIYQHLMDYWAETMQDDAYLIAADGWVAKPAASWRPTRRARARTRAGPAT
jgi:type I restriction enzyme M protein